MRRMVDLTLAAAALLALGFLAIVHSRDLPMGIVGEWEWPRIHEPLPAAGLLIAAAGVMAYGGLAAMGHRALGDPAPGRAREAGWVAGLAVSAVALQVLIPIGAPHIYGLTKWSYIHYLRGATGYLEIAKDQARADPLRFLAEYPEWIAAKDSNHIGAHPPGLIAMYAGLLGLTERHGATAGLVIAATPPAVDEGFRRVEVDVSGPAAIPSTERAAVVLASLIALLACAGTVVPLYLLARESLSPRWAWASSALWPLASAPNLFQPLSDTMYPFLSASALALAAWSARLRAKPGARARTPALLAIGSGAAMAFGMFFSLAFLPIGLIAGLMVMATPSLRWTSRLELIAWIGAGCAAVVGLWWLTTGANPFVIWWWNLWHNARFYEGHRRSYFPWILINPVELAIAAGLPVVVWFLVGAIGDPRGVPRVAWSALAVLVLVDLSGRNLGEVARLWMIFLPALFPAAGAGLARLGAGGQALFVTLVLMGMQTLGLQCMLQFVYPF